MAQSIIRNVPLNRVEGDLEIRVEVADGVVTDAWSSGTMFRGFERILVGRGAMDGLVITPRICGLCNMCHLTAAARALDGIAGVQVPDNAIRVRNVALMAEHIQSDVRHGCLMFLPDFTNPRYGSRPLREEAVRRYKPYAGEAVIETIRETKKIPEIMSILGGQWPHSSFMVPGGVVCLPNPGDILECRQILASFRSWYERRLLGCSLERWQDVKSVADLDAWLDESPAHRDSDLGFFVRFARDVGLHEIGRGHGNFISYGALDLPRDTKVVGPGGARMLVPAGVAVGAEPRSFDQGQVAEQVAHSWFEDYEGGRHPFQGETRPYATGAEGAKYSWCKAPRYDGLPAETGPLAEMVISARPLFVDLLAKQGGPSVLSRELARLVRPAELLGPMDVWLQEIVSTGGELYRAPEPLEEGDGVGLTQAARGALGHWLKVKEGKIEHYQIITPTAWNGSPRDGSGARGPWEQALVGTPVEDVDNPVEVGHVVRSYDACLVCSVHAFGKGGRSGRIRV